jgi:hypothetical protein
MLMAVMRTSDCHKRREMSVTYSYVCLGRGSSARLRGCRFWIAVSNTLHENEPCMQMSPSSSAYIARLAMGKHAIREVHTGRFRSGAGRGHRMFPKSCADLLHTHTSSRTHETRELRMLSVALIVKPSFAPAQVWISTSQPRKIGLLRI